MLLLVTGLPGSGKTSFATAAATRIGAPVIGHDWVMAGLRAHPRVWEAMTELDEVSFRTVGWKVMWNIGRAQLRDGRSVVLDGVARAPEIATTRALAAESTSRCVIALCEVPDEKQHHDRIAGRAREIPGWPELCWSDVERSKINWRRPVDVDVVLDSTKRFESNMDLLEGVLLKP